VDIESLFNEFDSDGGGSIEYAEMAKVLRMADKQKEAEEARRLALPPVVELPVSLQRRRLDVMHLYRTFQKQQAQMMGIPPSRMLGGLAAPSSSSADGGGLLERAMASGKVATFEQALRVLYPKDRMEVRAPPRPDL
jgi:hypothetical protein